ncbi:hypothetical protein EJ05DRAFT_507597 [Pseudovirgaria hyperparasitica]|uniref:ER-bound oxygenase mpaB/mpaB'/Rubber oxygenase catalytic domain-containing protein n=1 Tax=Pseudovirgaria hyperparasitica TaxID=470096 RepID=A0A6A6WGQ8_9PEZI|nr:uncharacterized protein EJ05DRAFT_507597 [Pseudovirgaria hyperparasitica]KAF2761998.1 hypothetical protein EJ05DRAFT_507597 [Pseudovirgaria hyperparasitica]
MELIATVLQQWRPIASLSILGYLGICQALRFRRLHDLQRRFPMRTKEELASMTVDQAYEIQRIVMDWEFPYMVDKALNFALFKTYGIPTISSLLQKTTEFSAKNTAGKRAVDTTILIGEFLNNPPSSKRACSGISRMNYIHSKYQRAGKISNPDMLYTLALFALEPSRWIARHEWRALTPLELCAFGVFWKSVGDAMGISYPPLLASDEWRDGLHWLDELAAWADAYEAEYMVPAQSNRAVADHTTKILTYGMPESEGFTKFGRLVTATLMDERLRIAMMYDKPPAWLQSVVDATLKMRKFVMRYAALPRRTAFGFLSEEPDKETGKLYRKVYLAEPWYVPERYKWSVQGALRWVFGLALPAKQWQSEGYVVEEVGPFAMKGQGLQEFEKGVEDLMGSGRGGCPFGKI